MQHLTQKFRESSIVSEKPDILIKTQKTLTSLYCHRDQYFSWNFANTSYLPMSKKGCSRFFKFCLGL